MKYKFKTNAPPPWDHQLKCLKLSWNKPYFALLLEYGTGKTRIIIDNTACLFEMGEIEALVIIAPNSVHERWITEQTPSWLPGRIKYIARFWENKKSKKYKRSLEDFWRDSNEDKLKIFTINVEALQSSTRAQNFSERFVREFPTFLTVDESTRIKSPGARRTKFIINHLSKWALYKRTLTGNEITRSPFDVYSPYRFLERHFWRPIPNYHVFTHRYGEFKTRFTYRKELKLKKPLKCWKCREYINKVKFKRSVKLFAVCQLCNAVLKDKLPWNVKKILDNDGKQEFPKLIRYKNLNELKAKTSKYSFLVRKEDCMDIPPKIYESLYTEMNSEQKRTYRELKEDLITEYEDVELSVVNKISLMVRFQQIVGGFFPNNEDDKIIPLGDSNPKIDRMLYDLEDIDTGSPIIIWARFVPELIAIHRIFQKEFPEKNSVLYYGGVKKKDRPFIIDSFQNNEIHFLISNPAVGGTGLNLQNSHINYYLSNDFNSENRWQSEDRTHRGGQTLSCLYKDIYIKGTVDDTIKKANETKKHIAEFFKDQSLEELI